MAKLPPLRERTSTNQIQQAEVVKANRQPPMNVLAVDIECEELLSDDEGNLRADRPCSDYRQLMFSNCRLFELSPWAHPPINHEVDAERLRVVRWIVQTCCEVPFSIATAALAVSIFDRANARNDRKPFHVRLNGLTAFWIASKMEEDNPLSLSDLNFMCGGLYTQDEIIACESDLLEPLAAAMTCPDPTFYLSSVSQDTVEVATLFLLAVLFHHNYQMMDASALAAAAITMVDPAVAPEWFCPASKVAECAANIASSLRSALDDTEHPLYSRLIGDVPKPCLDKALKK
jgi:hypothetical protein